MPENANNTENTDNTENVHNTETINNTENTDNFNIGDITENIANIDKIINSEKKKKAFKNSILSTALILGLITAVTVFAIAIVNAVSSMVVEKRFADEKEVVIKSLFGYDIQTEELTDFELSAPVTEIAAVYDNISEQLAGYCVTVEPQGFAGEIIMLVAVNPDDTVKDTKILSMYETAGYGSKLDDENEKWFRDQFISKPRDIQDTRAAPLPGENAIQIIAGATVSSKAFLNGVNAALDAVSAINEQISEAAAEITEIDSVNEIPENTGEEQNPDE